LEETSAACNKWLQSTLFSDPAPRTNKFSPEINDRKEINDGRNSTLRIHGWYNEYQDPRIKVAMINLTAFEDFCRRLIQRNIERRKRNQNSLLTNLLSNSTTVMLQIHNVTSIMMRRKMHKP
jgi:hypothetical protein